MTFIELGELCDKGTSNLAQKDLLIDSGRYPVYGAAGEITKVDFYQQSKPYLGIVMDITMWSVHLMRIQFLRL